MYIYIYIYIVMRKLRASTRADSCLIGVNLPWTKGRPRISRPGDSYREFLLREMGVGRWPCLTFGWHYLSNV